jgi:hypothetical protein
MERTAPKALGSERVLVGRLLRVGALAAFLSASANALVLAGASSLFGTVVIPPDETVTLGQVVAASVVGSIGAAVAFAVVGHIAERPVGVFWGIAAVGLLLSFIPIALAGATGSSAGTLAFMHVVAAGANVGLLTKLGQKG